MRLAVCDDEKIQRDYIITLLDEWSKNNNIGLQISEFADTEKFWLAHSEQPFDGALLDIEMPGQNGMDFARSLREQNDKLPIIFITGFAEFMAQGYEVDAIHYLLKPVDKNKLFECLNKMRSLEKSKILIFESSQGLLRIPEKDIVYLEAFGHNTTLHCVNGVYELNFGISKLEKQVDKNVFIRCHRSYLVNLNHVYQTDRENVVLDSGEKLPLSRRMYDGFNRALLKFYRNAGT